MNEPLNDAKREFLLDLFELEKRKVYSVVLRITRGPDLAEEAFQDTFLRLAGWIRDNTSPLPDVNALHGLVQVTAARAATNALRKHIRISTRKYAPNQLFASRSRDLDRDIDAENILNQLSPRERSLVDLANQGYSSEELGRKLGMTQVAVRVMKHRIFHTLKEFSKITALGAWRSEIEMSGCGRSRNVR